MMIKTDLSWAAVVVLACLLLSAGLNLTGTIDLNDLPDYANQPVPAYILQDNTPPPNPITDAGATLGRVLFYDQNLSVNNTVSCASCHQQPFAFGDPAPLSEGVAGSTGRHSMRLVNARFSAENRFFWDERADNLEQQVTMPIQDHVEMGFNGTNGDPGLDSLLAKMAGLDYYAPLFQFAFGDPAISEMRMQRALAQFVRSMQSFDSKFDAGLAQAANLAAPFPNFSPLENQGKTLFLTPAAQGGAGCQGCHRAPEFDIDPNSLNNGVVGVAGQPGETDLTNTRSPSLRDLLNPNGVPNGPFMHNGVFGSLLAVVNHYDSISPNPGLDPRLQGGPPGTGQNLNLTQQEKNALVAFLGTLTGEALYTDERWSDPFGTDGQLTVLPFCAGADTTVVAAEICQGETWEGYTAAGTYADTFVGADGCDSTRVLHLGVLPTAQTTVTASICAGEAFQGFTQTGVYELALTAANGCDSLHLIDLTVLPADDPACAVSAAAEDPVGWDGMVFPNPFQQEIHVRCDCPGPVVFRLLNLQGQTLRQGELPGGRSNATLSVGELPSGLYWLEISEPDGGRRWVQRLVK